MGSCFSCLVDFCSRVLLWFAWLLCRPKSLLALAPQTGQLTHGEGIKMFKMWNDHAGPACTAVVWALPKGIGRSED
jgi:hypothetical protein